MPENTNPEQADIEVEAENEEMEVVAHTQIGDLQPGCIINGTSAL
ncbi:hypothetical protein OG909_31145 [Streptomyces sp. NBC_01754]|nr:hypothetical protein [Streptomyces sp. NBC_01754]WSC96404.1 hypothetical protein OG909_31145 [Streptomyces sp. NBC_01754]